MRVTVHEAPLDPPDAVLCMVRSGEADVYAGPSAPQAHIDHAVTGLESGLLPPGSVDLRLPQPRPATEPMTSPVVRLTTPA